MLNAMGNRPKPITDFDIKKADTFPQLKQLGNELFKRQEYELAVKAYAKL